MSNDTDDTTVDDVNGVDDGDDNPVLGFPKRWLSKLPDGWADTVNTYSTEDLKKTMVDCERSTSEVEKEQENDVKLSAAKELCKELGGAYRDTLKMYRAKIKFLVYTMDQRGV